MTQTAAMTAAPRMPWTPPRPSASSQWGWVKSTYPSTPTTTTTAATETASATPSATAPPHPRASPTLCRPGSACALTLRRAASPSTTPTPCDLCGKVTWIARAPSARLSVSSAGGRCSCRSWWPTATQIRRRSGGSPSSPAAPTWTTTDAWCEGVTWNVFGICEVFTQLERRVRHLSDFVLYLIFLYKKMFL